MKEVNSETALAVHELGVKIDQEALKIIKELGLKDKQQITEDDLVVVTRAKYPNDYDKKLNCLLASKYFDTFYILDLTAKRDDSDSFSAEETTE